jgi:hypothetical protein
MSAGGGTMTLLFSVGAVERLAAPAAAIEDARQWSDYVGVVGNDEAATKPVESYVDGLEADPDFVAGAAVGSLAAVRQRFRTDRHVVVGTSDADRDVAAALGWEYLPVEAAAAKAEWSLVDAGEA